MQPLKISLETAQKLAKALGMPIERIMHMPQHILVQKLLELEKSKTSNHKKAVRCGLPFLLGSLMSPS